MVRDIPVDAGEIQALFASLGDDPASARDAAILSVLYGGGLRRSEAVALQVDDYDGATGALTVRHGKGDAARQVWATNGGKEALDAWLRVRGTAPGALLQPVNKGGRIERRAMSAQAVMMRLRSIADRAGVRRFSPHDLRRSFVGELLDGGADISSVQGFAGHASVTTTQRYDRRGDHARKRAAELLHVPYQAPRKAA